MQLSKVFNVLKKYKAEFLFLTKLLSVSVILNYGTKFWIGACEPGNIYFPWAEKYFNYPDWLKFSLAKAAIFFSTLLGYPAYQVDEIKISVINGSGVNIGFGCIGYGIMGFWIAFIYAYPRNLVKKIKWLLGGLLVIWFINMIRILVLLLLVNQPEKIDVNKFGNHHDVFNYIAYAIIIAMIFFYTKEKKIATTPIAAQQNPS